MRRHIEIIGNLTADATIYSPQNSTNNRVCINFNVAVNSRFKDKQGNVTEKAHFFACAYWKDKANTNIANFLKRGVLVFVEGLPEASVYQDKSGNHVPQLKIEASNIVLLSGSKKEEQQQSTNNNNVNNNSNDDNDDLPF